VGVLPARVVDAPARAPLVLDERGLGIDVPRDLSVVGFDDSPLARRLRPQLTTVHQDVREKGRLAAAALRGAMEHNRAGTPGRAEHVVLPTELVVRDSTAKPPG
jgi:DNA-binding LacI/PurR family transcriptional regulator